MNNRAKNGKNYIFFFSKFEFFPFKIIKYMRLKWLELLLNCVHFFAKR